MDQRTRDDLLIRAFARPPGPWEWFLEGLALLGLVSTWVLLLFSWRHLPAQIPTHFGFSGAPDAYGPRESLLPLVGVQFALWIGLSLLMRLPPHRLNFPVAITEANVDRMALSTRIMNRALKALVVLLFEFLIVEVVMISVGARYRLPGWLFPVVLVLPLLIIGATLLYGSLPSRPARPGRSGMISLPPGGERASTRRLLWWGLVFVAVMLAALFIPLLAVPRWGMTSEQAVAIATGVVMITAGVAMPFLPPNLIIGIRTRWTLSSQQVWRHTHRWSTYIWVPSGLLLMVLGLCNWRPLVAEFLILATAAGASALASYLIWRRTASGS